MPDFALSAEASPMAMNDPIPLFLSDHTEQPEQPVIGKDRAVMSSRIVKTSILVVTAAAIVFAVLATGNPLVRFESAMASLFATSTPQDDTGQSMTIIQSTADAQALPPAASEAPTAGEIAVASKTADQGQAEIRQPPGDVLLNKFQAWAAEADARPQVQRAEPVQAEDAPPQVERVQPVQDAQAPVAENARPQVRRVQKQRQIRPVQNARAKAVRNARAQMRREDARTQAGPAQNTQAQERSVQNAQPAARPVPDAQPAWLPQSLGWRN
jgi:flagellar biosynthesis GTPase FlhF